MQHDGIWVEVVKAYRAEQGKLDRYANGGLEGDTTDAFAKVLSRKLEEVYYEELRSPMLGAINAGLTPWVLIAGDGGRANEVYLFTRSRPNCFATKGMGGWSTPAIGTPTKVDVKWNGKKRRRRGAELWPIGTWSLKAAFYYTNLAQGWHSRRR